METYRRVHVESSSTITLKVTEALDMWSIKVMTEENGRISAMVCLAGPTPEDAQKFADAIVRKNHTCDGRCGEWTRV